MSAKGATKRVPTSLTARVPRLACPTTLAALRDKPAVAPNAFRLLALALGGVLLVGCDLGDVTSSKKSPPATNQAATPPVNQPPTPPVNQPPAQPSAPPANQASTPPPSSGGGIVDVPSGGTTAWGAVLPEAPAAPPAASPGRPATPPPTTTPPAQPTTLKKAERGVGKKGRGYGKGVIATPAATLWAAKERITFEIQIPHAMDLFKALEGRAPKDHAEFMEKIVKENQIQLPVLPEGDRYMYDPKTEQLMVESPKPETEE
jgi:hypothetical protein